MNNNRKTTEFSAHLSRSRMRHYLHGQLSAEESRQVEVHLANCTQCSANLVEYIETEEADQYNTYAKQLSGKLKEQKIARRNTLSSFQVKAIRAAAAVVALFIFSFFGVKNIINKEVNNYQAEELSLPVKGKPVVATKMPVKKKEAVNKSETKEDQRLAENRLAKKKTNRSAAAKPVASTKKKEVVKKKEPVATKSASKPKNEVSKPAPVEKKAEASAPKKEEPKQEPAKKVAETEKVTRSADEKPEVAPQTEPLEAVKPIKTPTAIKKVDATKQLDITKPVGSSAPAVVPVPGGRLR